MIRPDAQVIKAFGLFLRQHPEALEWVEGEYLRELENLPNAVNNAAMHQGRCQVWGELVKFLKATPAMAAKL
jgi:hypothetical protein